MFCIYQIHSVARGNGLINNDEMERGRGEERRNGWVDTRADVMACVYIYVFVVALEIVYLDELWHLLSVSGCVVCDILLL